MQLEFLLVTVTQAVLLLMRRRTQVSRIAFAGAR